MLTGTEILPVPDYKPTEVEKNITKEKNQVKSIIENDKDADKQSNLPEGISEEAIKRREEYDKIAKKLKNSFKKKDKAWLKNLVDDDASLATKRILLSKLMEENHTHISQELATIRFGGKIFMRFYLSPQVIYYILIRIFKPTFSFLLSPSRDVFLKFLPSYRFSTGNLLCIISVLFYN